jgi:hypothetical protein
MNIWVKLSLVAFGPQSIAACATAGTAAIGTGIGAMAGDPAKGAAIGAAAGVVVDIMDRLGNGSGRTPGRTLRPRPRLPRWGLANGMIRLFERHPPGSEGPRPGP